MHTGEKVLESIPRGSLFAKDTAFMVERSDRESLASSPTARLSSLTNTLRKLDCGQRRVLRCDLAVNRSRGFSGSTRNGGYSR